MIHVTRLDTAPEVFLVVVVAVYATVPEQGESAAGRSSQEPGRSRTKCGTCPDARYTITCAPSADRRRSPRLQPAPRATPPAAVLVADVPSEPGPLDTIVIGQQVPGGVHTPYRVATSPVTDTRYIAYTRRDSGVTNARARVGTCVVKTCVVKNSTHATWSPRTR